MNLAAQRGDTVTLRRLVELGAPVEGDAGERHGNTPLAEAVARRRPEAAGSCWRPGPIRPCNGTTTTAVRRWNRR